MNNEEIEQFKREVKKELGIKEVIKEDAAITKEEIMKIQDRTLRHKAIAENIDLFN